MQKKIKKASAHSPLKSSFPIVGIGASAGGLEAFVELFSNLPPDTGMAFVLIQHLSPEHLSLLSTIVQKATKMPVREVKDGMRVEANRVYVIPPNTVLEIFHGTLHLSPIREAHGFSMPVNGFLNSLARDQGNLAIGVILSGTGSDGAQALSDIAIEGGITFVQNPKTAKFDGMPLAAIAHEEPDHILDVKDISKELVKIAANPMTRETKKFSERTPSKDAEQQLQKIFIFLRNATKIDFSTYKYATVIRRIKKRMVLNKIETLKHYLTFLHNTPAETQTLFDNLLIHVTEFFRDLEAFESLKANVYPEIIKDKEAGTIIRIWVPACSTGEEVYSIAITFLEHLENAGAKFPIQIYGTDIAESAIKIARAGLYSESISKNLSAERLQRFFTKEQGAYRISRAVRDCCIFSIQDVTRQPPINRLDLLSCRNLMIYLGPSVQKKLMETFFYALGPNGFLMLGASESIGAAVNLFSAVDKKNKIYSKKSVLSRSPGKPVDTHPENEKRIVTNPKNVQNAGFKHIAQLADPVTETEQLVLNKYAPAWVLVNKDMNIVQFRGATERYVFAASGQPSWNLMRMLREGFLPEVRRLIHSVIKEQRALRITGLKIKSERQIRVVDVEISPVIIAGAEPHYLVLFIEKDPKDSEKKPVPKSKGKISKFENIEITNLKSEMLSAASMHKSLQSIIGDQSITNEELQSANEEVLSSNEELQSTNEELETAKEELQSTNEELTTLNEELANRVSESATVNNDLSNILHNIDIPIVMVGPKLLIRRFTPLAEKLLHLITADIGRKLTDINLGIQVDDFESKVEQVMKSATAIEIETHNHTRTIRIRPYKTFDEKIDGAVIIFADMPDLKKSPK